MTKKRETSSHWTAPGKNSSDQPSALQMMPLEALDGTPVVDIKPVFRDNND